MQTLEVVPRLFPEILDGTKRATIRWHETRIVPGPMRYLSEGATPRSVVVTVTRCTDMRLREVAAFLGREAEWSTAVMLSGMREHYPAITLDDLVQVIEHDPPIPVPS